ncbi:MFS general substrate transporter [Hypoxylon sp. FL1857]|nr:MFS general substrate transporter [Hypoxylon sp. FL1857]
MAAESKDGTSPSESVEPIVTTPKKKHPIQFWAIFAALCVLSFICALDASVIAVALPTITRDIGGATKYVWIANSFVIASTVPQPLYGQVANVFGRRIPFISAILLFILGSGIAGGASNPAMLIGGRLVQGLGAGGIYVLNDIVCCDLVPQRERGKYLGLMFSWSGVGAAVGPVIGGSLADANWRWIFYMNLPICALPLMITVGFFQTNAGAKVTNPVSKLFKLDYLGSLIFMGSMVSILLGLVRGGVEQPWSSWKIILPLVLGIVGWIAFHVHQTFFTNIPSVPSRLFKNRTSATAHVLTLFSSITIQSMIYFIPLYFQAVLGTSVLESGLNFLPFAIGTLAFAVLSGILLSVFGTYRPIHASGFGIGAISFGVLTLLGRSTSKVAWVFIEIVSSMGQGLVLSVLLPAILASLPESDVAAATATFSFIRSFGYVWGVTIASIIFNAFVDQNLYMVDDPILRDQLSDGAAYAFASQAHSARDSVPPSIWDQVLQVYIIGLKAVWWFGLAVSLVAFLAVWLEEGLELRKDLETDDARVSVQSIPELRCGGLTVKAAL